MEDPVTAMDGYVYERSGIERCATLRTNIFFVASKLDARSFVNSLAVQINQYTILRCTFECFMLSLIWDFRGRGSDKTLGI